ncbi:MAG: heparan-alpha-glucosaminide N-acetyltransferase domain-containing protein [Flavobacteriaceae bacterium]
MAAKRLVALDVLRGFTIALMIMVNTPGSWSYVYPPLRHSDWDGATPTDLVFPFFLFIVGVSMWYSFKKYGGGITRLGLKKVLKRVVIIFLLGLFLNALPYFEFEKLRIYGVLQRIAIAYGIAALLCMKFDYKKLTYVFVILLLGYWALIYFGGTGNGYSLEGNVVRQLDLFLFGENHIYGGFGIPFDPEGLLSSIPSIATVLLGYFTGRIIENSGDVSVAVKKLAVIGIVFVIIGLLWDLVYPINKPIWSSSYVVYTGGLAMLFLAFLLWLIDIKNIKKVFMPFIHFGTNPLFIFMFAGVFGRMMRLVKVTNSTGESVTVLNYYYSEILVPIFGNMNGSLFFAVSHIIFFWFLTYILYKKKIFIKI